MYYTRFRGKGDAVESNWMQADNGYARWWQAAETLRFCIRSTRLFVVRFETRGHGNMLTTHRNTQGLRNYAQYGGVLP